MGGTRAAHRRPALLFVAAVLSLAVTCTGPSTQQIGRERAIEIARAHVSFQPDSIDAQPATSGSRPVWRVTFRGRLPGQPPGLFETVVIDVDRQNGEVVSLARP